ncbi:MAG: fibronectin type III domain-containing protein [Thioalkalivibrio sp.]
MKALLSVTLMCLSVAWLAPVLAEGQPTLSASTERATGGYFSLSWDGASDMPYELQEAREPGFDSPRSIYEGRDTASVISGKPDGDFFYRVRALNKAGPGPWSEPARVSVAHHSLARALQFFFVGALVFAVLVTVIIRGTREDRSET